jgi:hypothetical protein
MCANEAREAEKSFSFRMISIGFNSRFSSAWVPQGIPVTAVGFQGVGPGVDVPDFGADFFDMRINRAVHARVGLVPRSIHQFIAAENAARSVDQHLEQTELVTR